MKKMSMILGLVAVTFTAVTLLPHTILAYKGDPNVQGPNFTQERHDAMTKAFLTNDYTAWKALVGDRGISRKITASNFAQFARAQQLAQQGKTAEAQAIRSELGLGQRNGNGTGQGNGQGRMQH